jgi:hypothetical protein
MRQLRRQGGLAFYMGCCANRGEDPVIVCRSAGRAVRIVLAPQRAAPVEKQKSRPPRLLVVRRERLLPGLGDARLRSRKEERAAGAGGDRQRARVA